MYAVQELATYVLKDVRTRWQCMLVPRLSVHWMWLCRN